MPNQNEIVIYQANDNLQLQVRLENDTVWLNRNQMALLFGRDVKTIGKHIANALSEELSVVAKNAPTPTIAKFATVQQEGTRAVVRNVEYYSLDVILSVGYRVKSSQGIAFRQWANQVLKQYRANFHDRFLIIDDNLYHFGASFKDLGKRLFAFDKMNMDKNIILNQL